MEMIPLEREGLAAVHSLMKRKGVSMYQPRAQRRQKRRGAPTQATSSENRDRPGGGTGRGSGNVLASCRGEDEPAAVSACCAHA